MPSRGGRRRTCPPGTGARATGRATTGTGSIPAHVYLPADTDVSTGSLFVVDRALDCPEGYVGVELEASGPGFGVAGALAGVGGLVGFARHFRSERGE